MDQEDGRGVLIWSLTAGLWSDLLRKALRVIRILMPTGHDAQRRLPGWPPGDHLCTHLSKCQADESAGLRVKAFGVSVLTQALGSMFYEGGWRK